MKTLDILNENNRLYLQIQQNIYAISYLHKETHTALNIALSSILEGKDFEISKPHLNNAALIASENYAFTLLFKETMRLLANYEKFLVQRVAFPATHPPT